MKAKQTKAKRGAADKAARRKRVIKVARTDNSIPVLAGTALAAASRKARAAGLNIMEVTDNSLTLVTPDGKRTFVKTIEPDIPVVVGKKISLR